MIVHYLRIDKRIFTVPQSRFNMEKFGFGSSQFWYGKCRKDDVKSHKNAGKYTNKTSFYFTLNPYNGEFS